jgi:choline dehydrogenase
VRSCPAPAGEALDNLIRRGDVDASPDRHRQMGGRSPSWTPNWVYGVKNLRIAGGSIMPSVTGRTLAPCVIIGERMADILKD